MKTNKNEAKTMTKYISCDYKWNFNSGTCNSNQRWNNKACQCECESYRKWERNYSWNPIACICEDSKYLKSIVDTSVVTCDDNIFVMDNVTIKWQIL